MREPRRGEVVEELGVRDESGGRGVFEVVPGAGAGEEVVSEACGAVFGAVR